MTGPGVYLLDTDVVSETARERPVERVVEWIATLDRIRMSAVSVFEIARGIERLRAGRSRRFLEAWFARLMATAEVLPFGADAALWAARIEAAARRGGRTPEERDLFILSCARAAGLRIATRNVAHFRGHGIAVLDPFVGVETP